MKRWSSASLHGYVLISVGDLPKEQRFRCGVLGVRDHREGPGFRVMLP